MKKVVSLLLSFSLCSAFFSPALAVEPEDFAEPNISMVSVESAIPFERSLEYEISSDIQPYSYLSSVLKDAEIMFEDRTLNLENYSLEIADHIPIENAERIVEVGKVEDTYCISYYTKDGNFVILEYLPDGTVNTYVRSEFVQEGAGESLVTVTAFNGEEKTVLEYIPSVQASQNPVPAAVKTVEFPTPEECGHRDTGPDGIVLTTQRVYIDQLRQDMYIRVVEIESNYKKEGSGFTSWAVGELVSTIAAIYAFPTLGFGEFLTYLGVAVTTVQGALELAEAVRLPNYANYIATEGKYGDILDTTVYHTYCRVYDNTGKSVYQAGLLGDGTFNYTKRGYSGIKSNSEIIDKVAYNFNACIATNGSNTMYFPADWD